jgi:hypothetical protein
MSTVAVMSKYVKEGRQIAEHTAFKLGYPLVTMDDLAKAASKESNIPENEFLSALRDVSFYHHLFRKRKMKLVSLMELKLCELMAQKPIVFCGYLGYPIFREISHVLEVLVLVHPEPGEKKKDERVDRLSDDKIMKWCKMIYEADMEDPNLYDLSVNLWHMDESEGADIIINTLKQKRFTPMTYSKKVIRDLELAYRIKAKLIEKMPDVQVKSHDSTAYVYSKVFKRRGKKTAMETKQAIMWMEGVDYVEIFKDQKSFQGI